MIAQYEPTPSSLSSDRSKVCICISDTIVAENKRRTDQLTFQDQNSKASIIAADSIEPEAKLGEGEGRRISGDKTCVVLSCHVFTHDALATLILRPEGYCER